MDDDEEEDDECVLVSQLQGTSKFNQRKFDNNKSAMATSNSWSYLPYSPTPSSSSSSYSQRRLEPQSGLYGKHKPDDMQRNTNSNWRSNKSNNHIGRDGDSQERRTFQTNNHFGRGENSQERRNFQSGNMFGRGGQSNNSDNNQRQFHNNNRNRNNYINYNNFNVDNKQSSRLFKKNIQNVKTDLATAKDILEKELKIQHNDSVKTVLGMLENLYVGNTEENNESDSEPEDEESRFARLINSLPDDQADFAIETNLSLEQLQHLSERLYMLGQTLRIG
jgi:hypothetical protein